MSYCLSLTDWAPMVGRWLWDWQTLIGGSLALGAAWIGAREVFRQTERTTSLAREEIERRHSAARVILPLALSEIDSLVQKMADQIADALAPYGPDGFDETVNNIIDGKSDSRHFQPIVIPNITLTAFGNFVETLNREEDKRHIAELISTLQIYLSRFNLFDLNSTLIERNLIEVLLYLGKISFLNQSIYNYARFTTNDSFGVIHKIDAKDAWLKILSHAKGIVFLQNSFHNIASSLDEFHQSVVESDINPWLVKY